MNVPIARIRLKVPVSDHEAGEILEATAIVQAAGYRFFEVGEHLITDGLQAELIEAL